jgi:hypothetical protein
MGECGTAGQDMQAVVAQALTACLFADDLRPGHPGAAQSHCRVHGASRTSV